MSVEKARMFTFGKDYSFVTITSTDSSIRPLSYRKWFMEKKENEEVFDFVKRVLLNVLEGNIHIDKKNYISYVIDQTKKVYGTDSYLVSRYQYSNDFKGQAEYDAEMRRYQIFLDFLTDEVLHETYLKEFNEEKNKKYVLVKYSGEKTESAVNDILRIVKINNRSYRYMGNLEPATINGVDLAINDFIYSQLAKNNWEVIELETFQDKKKLFAWVQEKAVECGW